MNLPEVRPHLLLSVLLLAGCGKKGVPLAVARVDTLHAGLIQVTSTQPTGWSDTAVAWKYRVTLKIQPEERSPGELLQPGNLSVDSWGRVYVADSKPAVIKVFDSTGAFLRTIGREGAGPGEFKVAFIAVRGSHLVVQDPIQSRTSVFDTSGTFIRSWTSSCCYWDDIIIDSSDVIYLPSMSVPDSGKKSRGSVFRRFKIDGTAIDTAWIPQRQDDEKRWTFSSGSGTARRNTMMASVPFSPTVVKALHPHGGFVIGWTGEYRIMRSLTGEDTTIVFARGWTPDPIPDELRKKQVEDMVANAKDMVGEASARESARLSDIPTRSPAYQSLRVDLDGNIWARQLVGSDSVKTRFDVFAPSGAWLGTLSLPISVPEYGGQFFGHGVIYGVAEDNEGRPMIVRVNRVQ